MSEVRIDGSGDIAAEHDAGKPEETLPVGCRRMPAANPGKGQVDDGPRSVAHELKLLGRRHASPRFDLALLDRGRSVEGEHSRRRRAVAGRHPVIIGFAGRSICVQFPPEHHGRPPITVGLNH